MLLIPYQVDVPMRRWPIANFTIIAVTVGAFVLASADAGWAATFEACVLRGYDPVELLGVVLTHADWLHLVGNMLMLWVFGNAVCAKFGNGTYLVLYLACAGAASVAHLVGHGGPAVGASGAINGVVGMFLVLYPRNDVTCLWYFFYRAGRFDCDARWLIAFWFVLDVIGALGGGGSVGHIAHLGGFVAGFVIAAFLLRVGFVRMEPTERSLFDVIDEYMPARREEPAAQPMHAGGAVAAGPSPFVLGEATAAPSRPRVLRCGCGHRMRVHARHSGKRARCPQCRAEFTVPDLAAHARTPAPA